MSIKRFFPEIRPTLDLNFAATKRLDPRITYTRASTGTFAGGNGLIQSAAVNQARFEHNPLTGESLGLLVEEARTNSWTRSEEFNDAAWTKTDTTVTANAATAPDGSLTADKLIASATTAVHSMQRVKTLNSPSWTTIYLKAAEYTICDVKDINLDSAFRIDLTSGAISSSPAGTFRGEQCGVDAVGNGWYRIRIGFDTANATINNPVLIYPNGGASYLGDGTSGILVWGAQLEAGAFPTSYIPTVASTVTRAADVASITGANFSSWYNNTEGTFVTDAILAFTQNAGNPFTFGGVFYTTVTETVRTLGNGTIMGGLSNSLTSFSKTAVALKSGDFAIGRGGGIASTSSFAYTPTGSEFRINSSFGSLAAIKRLVYYPVRLPNAQLQALTK